MANWYLDEGLNRLRSEWRVKFPNATVYTIGDSAHSSDPDESQHAPDRGGSKPGDDRGEVDGADFMPNGGPTMGDLRELFEGLRESRDRRILYLIFEDKIVSSVTRPWVLRTYTGKFHRHLHVSVNDNFDANEADWKWEEEQVPTRTLTYATIDGKLPELRLGDEDEYLPGYNCVMRAQALLNAIENMTADLDTDGVYGGKTAAKLARVMSKVAVASSTNGTKIGLPEWKVLMGLS